MYPLLGFSSGLSKISNPHRSQLVQQKRLKIFYRENREPFSIVLTFSDSENSP